MRGSGGFFFFFFFFKSKRKTQQVKTNKKKEGKSHLCQLRARRRHEISFPSVIRIGTYGCVGSEEKIDVTEYNMSGNSKTWDKVWSVFTILQ